MFRDIQPLHVGADAVATGAFVIVFVIANVVIAFVLGVDFGQKERERF